MATPPLSLLFSLGEQKINVSQLQKRIQAHKGEIATAPNEGSAEWNLFLDYLNMAQNYWAEAYQWSNLYKEYDSLSTNASTATIALQSDHRKFDGYLKVATTLTTEEYQQILPDERSQYVSTDKYFYVVGNPSSGYKAVVNPIPASGASIHYSYWANAATLASAADISMCPNPEFLVQKSLEYYWRAVDDARFQNAKADAETILLRMLESELTKGPSYDNRILTYEATRSSFRLGRD